MPKSVINNKCCTIHIFRKYGEHGAIDCNVELRPLYSKTIFKSTKIENSGKQREMFKHSKSIIEESFSDNCDLEGKTIYEDPEICSKIRNAKLHGEKFGRKQRTEENIEKCFYSKRSALKNNKLPKIEQTICKTSSSSCSVKTIYYEAKYEVRATNDSYEISHSLSSLKQKTSSKPSKLPILLKKGSEDFDKPKKSHWTEKYKKSYSSEMFDELKTHNFSKDVQNRCNNMYKLPNNVVKRESRPYEEILAFKRHNILTPIASKSASNDSNDLWSESGSFNDLSDVVGTPDEYIVKNPQINLLQELLPINTTSVCRKSHSDPVNLIPHGRNLLTHDNVDNPNNFAQCTEPWGRQRSSSRLSRNQRYQ